MSEKIKVLFLSAAPSVSGQRLRVDEEIREVEEQLRVGPSRDAFLVVSSFAVRTKDLQALLLREQPHIVHFSGHGKRTSGIVLEDEIGRPAPVTGDALAGLFRAVRTVRMVILNACESRETAEAFQELVDYTIAMGRRVTDRAAIVFSTAFYRGLSHHQSVPEAFALALNQLTIEQIPETDIPELFVRHGVAVRAIAPAPQEPVPAPANNKGHVVIVTITGNDNDTKTNVR